MSETPGMVRIASDGGGGTWVRQPQTAPLHQAPDTDERVGAIVGALAEALSGHAIGYDLTTPRQYTEHGNWNQRCQCGVVLGDDVSDEDIDRHYAEALAPTVARLMAQAAEEAVAERLAGVEALADRWARWSDNDNATGYRRSCAQDLRAALHPKETDR